MSSSRYADNPRSFSRAASILDYLFAKAIVMLFLQAGLRLAELTALDMPDLQLPKRISKDL